MKWSYLISRKDRRLSMVWWRRCCDYPAPKQYDIHGVLPDRWHREGRLQLPKGDEFTFLREESGWSKSSNQKRNKILQKIPIADAIEPLSQVHARPRPTPFSSNTVGRWNQKQEGADLYTLGMLQGWVNMKKKRCVGASAISLAMRKEYASRN